MAEAEAASEEEKLAAADAALKLEEAEKLAAAESARLAAASAAAQKEAQEVTRRAHTLSFVSHGAIYFLLFVHINVCSYKSHKLHFIIIIIFFSSSLT